ncbi:hypothetical protein D3C85_274340 [compost metagenome]
MNLTVTQQIRDEFEATFNAKWLQDTHRARQVFTAAWHASRDSIVVHLPPERAADEKGCHYFNEAVELVRQQLHAQGIKTY